MNKTESLEKQLTRLKERTAEAATAIQPAAFWIGDAAGERRAWDDIKSGRTSWSNAHRTAVSGLEALERGDEETAAVCLTTALWLYIDALEMRAARLRPEDQRKMKRSAGKRGRPPGSKNKQPSRER